ncbi:MAG: photosystem P840 reaction-center cytochrome c-551 [Proteobacteria bacterium]|nr:photosystem P840 reaction-center cytochrome c-551 [Pseudomonadota bacterium]
MRKLWFAGLAGVLLMGFGSVAAAQGTGDAKALFEEKCGVCHATERATGKKKDAAGWEKTVMRMKNVNGCPINDEQAKAIIQYLAKNYGP